MLAEAARGFLDQAAPVTHLRRLRDTGQTHDPDLWRQMTGLGWAGILVPEAAGGADMGHAAAGVLAGELGRTLVASPFLSTAVIAATALRQVSDERATRAMEAIAAGRATYALAIDRSAKFDPQTTEMKSERVGNGFRLSGRKRFVVDGNAADRLLVLARSGTG